MGIINSLNELRNANSTILNEMNEYKYNISLSLKEFMRDYSKENDIAHNKIINRYQSLKQYYEI